MITLKRRVGWQTCILTISLIIPAILKEADSMPGPVKHSFGDPTQTAWIRAHRIVGGGSCEKCDSPSGIQYAVVTVYADPDGLGKMQGYYQPGKYRADRGQLNRVGNDSISSLRVEDGYRVRLCQHEGDGEGAGKCQDFAAGRYNVSDEMNDETSFIWVWRG